MVAVAAAAAGSTTRSPWVSRLPMGPTCRRSTALTQSIGGHKPAMAAIWVQWGSGAPAFPTSVANGLRDRGITPFIWWEPVNSADLSDGTYSRHKNISDGDHDAYIRQFARAARDFGSPVLLRFAHEMNGSYFPWAVNKFDNTASTFIAAWRHVHGIFQAEGATNVKFVWSVARQGVPRRLQPVRLPVAWGRLRRRDGLQCLQLGNVRRQELELDVRPVPAHGHRHGARSSSKPIIVAETGSTDLGGDKAAWIRDGYRAVHDQLPQIKGIVYLNADLRDLGHPDWRLATPLSALTAYAQIAAMAEFSARSVFSDRRNVAARDVRSDRDKKDRDKQDKADKDASSEADARKDRGPRVQQGAETDRRADADEDKATGTKNRQRQAAPAVGRRPRYRSGHLQPVTARDGFIPAPGRNWA